MKKFLLVVMAMCLTGVMKAQFYDDADDIYYYVEYKNGDFRKSCRVLNFDGTKACILNEYRDSGIHGISTNDYYYNVDEIKSQIQQKSDYYEELVELKEYRLTYSSTASAYTYSNTLRVPSTDVWGNASDLIDNYVHKITFSGDRSLMYDTRTIKSNHAANGTDVITYKRVDKSYFKVGRQRTPSNKMYE